MNLLNIDENFFILQVDGDKIVWRNFQKIWGFSNIKVEKSIPVTWCGFSQVLALIKGLKIALESFEFDYLINLSGQNIVLKSDEEIKEFLKEKYKMNKKFF